MVAGNSEAIVLGGLSPDTQYQLTVAALWSGRKYRSRAIIFRTLGDSEGKNTFQYENLMLANNNLNRVY